MNKFSFFPWLLSFSSTTTAAATALTITLLILLPPWVQPQCSNEKLVLYQITATTHWTRMNFPKQYPEFRPPAQFSKLVGRSHSEDFKIFQIGQMASEGANRAAAPLRSRSNMTDTEAAAMSHFIGKGMKKFAETGLSDLLDEYSQGAAGVLDAFNAPAILQGAGETETQFFLDSNHTRVSLVMRIVPSPDWFIGISSLDLCVGNEWVDSLAINVTHLCDAGTDSGYTFTAPNFATVPPEAISRITSQEPNHKASSFYYPDKEALPSIATLTLFKLKEYSPWKSGGGGGGLESGSFLSSPLEDIDSNDIGNEISDPTDVDSTKTGGKRRRLRKFKGSRVRDCRVSEWSEWSECSALCGIGEQHRTRQIINHPRGGGAPCPSFTDKRLCSSDRDCRQNYFDW